jgi:tetratricopeptide (TPR) repeat protein
MSTRSRRRLFVVAAFLIATGAPASAQKPVKEPKRPKLAAQADTNDAHNYWNYGASKLVKDPYDAGDAFYWAMRIDPTWPEGFYARWVALQIQDPDHTMAIYEGEGGEDGRREALGLDSLHARAFMLDPFFFRVMENTLYRQLFQRSKRATRSVGAAISSGMFEAAWESGTEGQAIKAYTEGRFPDALKGYAKGVKTLDSIVALPVDKQHTDDDRDDARRSVANLHRERGRIFFLIERYDSAAIELRAAVSGIRSAESNSRSLTRNYESSEILQQSLGIVEERLGHPDSAREAYSRALEEDLSFAPAHFALAGLALAAHDTAQAVRELELGAQMQPNDPASAFFYGRGLIYAGHVPQSVAPLQRAVKLEPLFAEPHAWLAFVYEGSGYEPEAIEEYTRYLALAPAQGEHVKKAKVRLAALKAAAADTSGR